jgi:drug/metabolite transporter (DMT)-like permease
VAIKAASLPGPAVVGLRAAIATATLALLLPEARRGWTRAAVVAAVPCAATMLLFGIATKLTTAAHAIFLQSTAPLYLVGLGPWLLREPLRRADLAVLAVTFAGLVAVLLDTPAPVATAPAPALGNALACASGFTWALAVVGLRRIARERPGAFPGPTFVMANAFVALLTLPAAWPLPPIGVADGLVLAWLGVVQVSVGYACLGRGLHAVPALPASLLMLAEPVLNPLWVWLVQGEAPGRGAVVGGVLVLGATAWRAWHAARAEPAETLVAP